MHCKNMWISVAALALMLGAGSVFAQGGYGYGGWMGPGMMGYGWGGMGPGMMGPGWGGGGPGWRGMGPWEMGSGWGGGGPGWGGMGPGMMGPGWGGMGPGMMGYGWGRRAPGWHGMGPRAMGPGWGGMMWRDPNEIPDAALDAMAKHMVSMHELIDKLLKSTDPATKRKLLREYLADQQRWMRDVWRRDYGDRGWAGRRGYGPAGPPAGEAGPPPGGMMRNR